MVTTDNMGETGVLSPARVTYDRGTQWVEIHRTETSFKTTYRSQNSRGSWLVRHDLVGDGTSNGRYRRNFAGRRSPQVGARQTGDPAVSYLEDPVVQPGPGEP